MRLCDLIKENSFLIFFSTLDDDFSTKHSGSPGCLAFIEQTYGARETLISMPACVLVIGGVEET